MITDRTIIPQLIIPPSLKFEQATEVTLDNGLRLYVINAGTEEVVRFEIIFPSCSPDNRSYSLSNACHQLIDAGTSRQSALGIAEGLDFYGAYLQTDTGPDWKSTALFSITRFFGETIEIIKEILTDPVFPEDEVNTWKTRNIQTLKVNREKVSWLSKSAFNATIFGSDHPYGYSPTEASFETITAGELRNFYKTAYPFRHAILVASGKIDDAVINKINSVFGSIQLPANCVSPLKPAPPASYTPAKLVISKKDSVQSGVRIGKRLFKKDHPDYIRLSIVNTILGGYFGSRLMSNIREDKGYTYGIGSGLMPMRESGLFYISTETGNDVREAAIAEVYNELNRLINEPVPGEELLLVKNYLVGSFQRSIDGPFALSDRFKGLILHNLDYNYLDNYLKTLREITPESIMEIAGKHLQPASMSEIVAG